MTKRVLITGGAGFIGSHLTDELLVSNYQVRILDSLAAQVHGSGGQTPGYLNPEVEAVIGDIRDPAVVRRALVGVDGVFHFAAAVGVGQSMYEIVRYVQVNNLGTAVLLEALIEKPVERLVVASSMSLYGEGMYRTATGSICLDATRAISQLKKRDWEPYGPHGEHLVPIPTSEDKPPSATSVYALSKYDQERLCLIVGDAYGIPTVALRFFNVYGPRQALSNPYTGVLAIFAARLLNGAAPVIFEDGNQRRDFVHVTDVARAARAAFEVDDARGQVLNIGSGSHVTIRDMADKMIRLLSNGSVEPEITGLYRAGDVRNCFADITRAKHVLGYEPRVELEGGLAEYVEWLRDQIATDRLATARQELVTRGLAL